MKTQHSDHEPRTIDVEVLPPEKKSGRRQEIDAILDFLLGSVRHRLPKIVLIRMALNVLLNALFQGIPIVGDLFTFFFKANRRNYELLQKHAGTGKPVTRGDWIFVGAIIGIIFLVAISLSLLLIYAVWLTDPRWW